MERGEKNDDFHEISSSEQGASDNPWDSSVSLFPVRSLDVVCFKIILRPSPPPLPSTSQGLENLADGGGDTSMEAKRWENCKERGGHI